MSASTLHQHQTRLAARRPHALPAADQPQDRPDMCRAGILSVRDSSNFLTNWPGLRARSFSRISHLAVPPRRGRICIVTLPVDQQIRPTHKAERRKAARCVSARGLGCNPTLRSSIPHQQFCQVSAGLSHRRGLSSRCLPSFQHGRRPRECDHQFSVMRHPS